MHTRQIVYDEMLTDICKRYSTLPDPRTLTFDEIDFFYNGIRGELKRDTRPPE